MKRNNNKSNGGEPRMRRKQRGRKKGASAFRLVWRGGHFMPPRFATTLKFAAYKTLSNAGAITANFRLSPTDVNNIDPASSDAVPGFQFLGGMYRYFRVQASRIVTSFQSLEAFPLTCWVIPVNTDPTANHVVATTIIYSGQRDWRERSCGALTGFGVVSIAHAATTKSFSGSVNVGNDDNYSALTNGGSPVNNWFWDVGVYSANVLAVASVYVRVQVWLDVEFFEIGTPAT